MTHPNEAHTLDMTRRFAASVERVYQAWVEPDQYRQWFAPFDATIPKLELDVRVGGTYRVEIHNGPAVVVVSGTYSKVVKAQELAFSWDAAMPDGSELHSEVEVSFRDVGGDTEVHLIQRLFPTPELLEMYDEGWNSCFEQLGGLI